MFEKALGDLVRGIRAHTRDEAGYIAGCISEIKEVLLWGLLEPNPWASPLTMSSVTGASGNVADGEAAVGVEARLPADAGLRRLVGCVPLRRHDVFCTLPG